jgi:hypothetical protein
MNVYEGLSGVPAGGGSREGKDTEGEDSIIKVTKHCLKKGVGGQGEMKI